MPDRYTARLQKSAVYLYEGEKRIARFYIKHMDTAVRCAALLNGMSAVPNCPELDGFLDGRVVPEWVMFQMWKAAIVAGSAA